MTMTTRPAEVEAGRMFIGGSWSDAADGGRRDLVDPATGEVLTTAAEAGPEDVGRAAAAAREAFDDGRWSRLSVRERSRVLLRAAALIREHAEDLAALESRNVGKPIVFSRTIDVPTAADTLEYYAGLILGVEGSVRSTAQPSHSYTLREPMGVVAAITPFNFPLILSMTKIAPALAAGNTVVHKPAEETPLTALCMAGILREAGLPDGVYNVVTGGSGTGEALLRDPRVDKVAFTGSTPVGRKVAAIAAEGPKHVTMELGGKSANIVFGDADIEAAVGTAIKAFVFNTGQFCMAGSRLLVERPVYEDVLAALTHAVPTVPVGDPFDESTVVGPMTGPAHLEKVRSHLDQARHSATVAVGGNVLDRAGYYVEPTVISDVDQGSPLVQGEIFGPVLTVQPFDGEEEAVRMANGTPYGLSAGVQTGDLARAHRVSSRLAAGIVWVNSWSVLDVAVPFGGCGQSGYGRENGPEALDEYLRAKSVVIPLG